MQFLQSLIPNKGEKPSAPAPSGPVTRWEKAVAAVNGIVQQVSKVDPDGIDVLCFPGASDHVDVYRNVKDASSLKSMVGAREPGGPCYMGYALDTAFREAFARGFAKPCSMLVITAGRPDDYEQLIQNIQNAAKNVQKDEDLTVTFVQVGDDQWASDYLKYLDDNLKVQSASGEEIDIVDTIKDEEVKSALGEVQQPGFMASGGTGALVGAFAGMALGVGGMYMYNKHQAKKRTEGWNGKWRVTRGGQDTGVVLSVTDDMGGNLTIDGWPEEFGVAGEPTPVGFYSEADDSYFISREGEMDSMVTGTVEDEHNISWTDGTSWEEVPPEGGGWAGYAAAGAGGAAAGGAVGYLVQKKFFKKAANKDPSDYVIIVDRSQNMTAMDTGK